jgi:hypothetical protein
MNLGIGAALLIAEVLKDNSVLHQMNVSPIYKRMISLIEKQSADNPIKCTHMRCLVTF